VAVTLSIFFSCAAIVLGVLIITYRGPLADFLGERCALIDSMTMVFPKASRGAQLWHFAVPSSALGSLFLLLTINAILTMFLGAHDRIGSTSLVWLLHAEGRGEPKFNTNGRLVTGTKRFGEFKVKADCLSVM
jgi:hypothetical protein